MDKSEYVCPYKAGYNNANVEKGFIMNNYPRNHFIYVLGFNTFVKETRLIELLTGNTK